MPAVALAGLVVAGFGYGAHYPLSAGELADAQETFVRDYGLSLVGGVIVFVSIMVYNIVGAQMDKKKAQAEAGA